MARSAEHLHESAVEERKGEIDAMIGRAVGHLLGRGHHAPLAEYIGVAPSGVSRRLKGETSWAAAEVRLAAEFFRKPVAQLYTDPETWGPPLESLNVRGPLSQGSLFLPDATPAFDFGRSTSGVFGIAS